MVDVQVGAADAACLDRDDRVVAGLELRLGALVDLDFAGGLEGDGSHEQLLSAEDDRFAFIVDAFSSRSLLIPEKALAGLPPELPRERQAPERWRDAVALLAELVVEAVEHGHDVVKPDLIGPR